MNWDELIGATEADLYNGRVGVAAARLRAVTPGNVPRARVATIANLARRSQLDLLSLRCLSRLVRADRTVNDASPGEIAEYAATLQKIGAVREALDLLGGRALDALPVTHLYRAFALFRVWDYAAAIPELARYLEFDLDPHRRVVGELNLAAALVTTGAAGAAAAVDRVKTDARAVKQWRAVINAHEIAAQLRVREGDWAAARSELAAAAELGPEGADAFWVKKWSAVITALESGRPRALIDFQMAARAAGEWESVRDAAYFRLRLNPDFDRLHHLVFGTPHAAYRRRIFTDIAAPVATEWRYGSAEGPALSLSTGETFGGLVRPPTNVVHRALAALTIDLYRPRRVGDLFAEIFKGEYYDPHSSPNRVHQALGRLRTYLREERIAAEVREHAGEFTFNLTGPFALILNRATSALHSHDVALNQLRELFGDGRWFTPAEVRTHLKLSPSSFKRFVARAVTDHALERLGSGRATRYKFAG